MGGFLGTMQRAIRGGEDIDSLLKKIENIEGQLIQLAGDAKLVRTEIQRLRTKDTKADSEILHAARSDGCVIKKKTLRGTMRALETENQTMKIDQEMQSKSTSNKIVAIHFGENQQLFGRVEKGIQKLMKNEGVAVNFAHITEPEKRPSWLPIVVLCISASRLGTDVTTALQGIAYDHSVAVVIVHHAKPHALPTETSEWVLTEEKFEKLGLIVDIAFETSHGMYACDMNNKSIDKLCKFVTNFQQ